MGEVAPINPADRAEAPELGLFRVLAPDGRVVGPKPGLSRAQHRKIYEAMRGIRLLDERMVILQRQGRIGFYGACTGQEAPPIGTAAALRDSDWVFPALREGALMLYRGFSLERYLCQVLGNDGDVLKGRQMPSHYADRSVSVVSWGSCIGTQLPQAVGAAWAAKLQGRSDVSVAFMGDGATSGQDFHNAMNFAGVYRVPCVLICQNNHWSISVRTDEQTASETIAEKAVAYGMPYARVDGNDVLAVYTAVAEAAARARAGEGPAFLELLTYRIGAHSTSDDPRVYRSEEEVEIWRRRDPIERYRIFLENEGYWSPKDEDEFVAAHNARIQAALTEAEARPAPPADTLIEDVFETVPASLRAQWDQRGI